MKAKQVTRREFVRGAGVGAVALLCPWLRSPQAAEAASRPNVLIILADDMGYSDLGCYGGEIHTPRLDALAQAGLRFTQFYNAARCCPTRASLLTGLYPHQAGVGSMTGNQGTPAYQGYLNDRSVTIAEVLKAAGYRTYMSGKWHVGEKKGHWPLDRGFQRYFGLINGASNYFNNVYYRDPSRGQTILLDDQPFEVPATTEAMWQRNEGFYLTDAFTDHAVTFLDEHRSEQPFFLYLPYTAPHWPLHAFPADIAKYEGKYSAGWDRLRQQRYRKQIELGIIDASVKPAQTDEQVAPWNEATAEAREEFEIEMAIYAAMIDRMDRNIGRVIDKLKQMGQFDNTLILFLSDNGGCHTTPVFEHLQGTPGGPNSFPCYGFMGAELSNVPFRKYKQFIHEGGIASPLIVHYPNLIKKGRIQTQAGHLIDIMPTLVELCGARYPVMRNGKRIKPMPGISLLPALRGGRLTRKDPLYWEHVGNRGVRVGDWKLVAAKPDLTWELYNLTEDRTELNDLSERFPEKREQLIQIYEKWAKANGVKPRKPK
jgi:arylsulfatase A-like enzyme